MQTSAGLIGASSKPAPIPQANAWCGPGLAPHRLPLVHAPSLRRIRDTASDLRHDDLSVLDLHEVNVRHALSALLTRRSILLEFDRAVEAENIDFPEGSTNRLRLGLAGNLDGFGNSPIPS